MNSLLAGCCGVFWAAVLVVGCGGAGASDSVALPVCEGCRDPSNRFSVEPTLDPLPVEVRLGEPLAEAFERARQAYLHENVETFDPRRAYGTSAAREFAWYFTVNDANDAFGRTNHVFFVVTAPWDTERTRSFLLSYLVMPGAPTSDTGRLWFHFYSAEPPPFAVRFLFSNTPEGALEAAVLSELGTERWEAEQMPAVVQRIEEILDRLEITRPGDLSGRCPSVLDRLFTGLVRPPADARDDVFGRRFVPEGTLAAIGVLVGESIKGAIDRASWWETDSDFVYPRLHVTGTAEGILRPIPMMIEFYMDRSELLPGDYCRRMIEHLGADGPQEAEMGD